VKRLLVFVGLMLLLVVALAVGSGWGGFVRQDKWICGNGPNPCYLWTPSPLP
jgi:hypothetical protein